MQKIFITAAVTTKSKRYYTNRILVTILEFAQATINLKHYYIISLPIMILEVTEANLNS